MCGNLILDIQKALILSGAETSSRIPICTELITLTNIEIVMNSKYNITADF